MNTDEQRTFTEDKTTFSNGAYFYTFDVIKPTVWDCNRVHGWGLSRLMVRKSGIEVMRFEGPTNNGPWTKAYNPYAGFGYKSHEAQRISEVIRSVVA